jgi:poly-gamma-glutamate capsule biosynthesis protein CapA/YwtB (metallophosphatase superfamily)
MSLEFRVKSLLSISVLMLCPFIGSTQDSTKLSLLFIGDIMQHDTQIAAAFDPINNTYNYDPCFENVSAVFQSADLTIGNLELSLGGPPYKGYPAFSAPDELVHTLIKSGVDILVTANNHCLDRGKKGLQRTISVLDTLRIPHTGTFVDSTHRANTYPMLIEKNGIKFSLLNYTYGTNGIAVTKPNIVNYIDTTQIALDITKAKEQNPDLIITFFHWGDEYQRMPNKSQKSIAEFCFKRGVKLVIGSHPHVIQPMEWRKENDELVVYSLGNFVSGQSSRYKNGGAMLYVELEKKDSVTKIGKAEYELQYVYRDPVKKYHIIPVNHFEADTTLINEKAARGSMREFILDSRRLLIEHNLNVEERPIQIDSVARKP